jgi:hypothetical protein
MVEEEVQQETSSGNHLLSLWFLLSLLFSSEDGGQMFPETSDKNYRTTLRHEAHFHKSKYFTSLQANVNACFLCLSFLNMCEVLQNSDLNINQL